MLRRSFRVGLRLGVLVAIGYAVATLVKRRRSPVVDGHAQWPPLETDAPGGPRPTPPAAPTAPARPPTPAPAPAATAATEAVKAVDAPLPAPPPPARPPVQVPAAEEATATPAKAEAKAAKKTVKAAKKVAKEAAKTTAKKETAAKKAPAKTAAKKTTKKSAAATPAGPTRRMWVNPEGDLCPSSHPVKAKLSSRIFHVPTGLSYNRTRPDRCYESPEAATADGLRAAGR